MNSHGRNQNAHCFVSSFQDSDDVSNGRAVGRGHDSDATRQDRQRALAFDCEQTVGGKSFLQLLESKLQCARPDRFHETDDQLILAASVINREPTSRDNVQTVVGNESYCSILHSEAGAA